MSKTANQQKAGKVRNQGSARGDTYHGTRLAPAKGTERFTVTEIRRAVEAAIDKNPGLFAKRK
jgi:hypothetical protein